MKPSAAETAALFAQIADNAAHAEESMRSDLAATLRGSDPLLAEVLNYALLGGGKRLRPLLTAISSRLCGKGDRQQLRLLAAAFEYLHTATLLHDDVLDHAENRRGRKSVVSQYGTAAAILAGDWLHARSMHLIGALAGPQALEVFCAATAGMVDGEFLQMRCVADPTVTEAHYLAVISKKTAGLISAACAVGALHGQGNSEQLAALTLYGEKIGLSFQIADDLLDYLGDEQATGKKVGNDFAEGKMTLPLIHALSRAEGQDKAELLHSIQGDRHSAACVIVRQVMNNLGSFIYCRQRAEEEMATGLAALSCFTEDNQQENVAILRRLAHYVLSRDR
ncbi:MAG: octaprenyl-diphosphate synthase [Candidatus Electronema aureum]|uniref:Octaprenyl-diphosphate synthase n=1 Tax=Candidatus Electronema aureum TaxID=2005002 RepID=A0A521G1Z0_9BACT|nr:MAG: octaprenyl-diphosphate synthase [Candidatus Electronema aureum]